MFHSVSLFEDAFIPCTFWYFLDISGKVPNHETLLYGQFSY